MTIWSIFFYQSLLKHDPNIDKFDPNATKLFHTTIIYNSANNIPVFLANNILLIYWYLCNLMLSL